MSKQRIPSAHWWQTVSRLRPLAAESECPGAEGRINVAGQWVDRPVMTSGKPATTVLGLMPWPRWWVTR